MWNLGRLASVALFTLVPAGVPANAQAPPDPGSAEDLFVPAMPGLTATDLCVSTGKSLGDDGIPFTGDPNEDASFPLCVTGFGGTGQVDSASGDETIGSAHVQIEFAADDGAACPAGPTPFAIGSWRLSRISSNGALQPIGEFRAQCEESFLRNLLVLRAGLDQVNGELYVTLLAFNSAATTSNAAQITVKISGLPTLLGMLPPGPPRFRVHPSEPFSPDAIDTDALRVLALEKQVVDLQAQIDALRAAMDRRFRILRR